MKAGKSSDSVMILPRLSAKATAVSKVEAEVAMPRTSSTNFIVGAGFMKCRPMKRSGRSVAEARRVIEIEEVLDASRVSGPRSGVSSVKTPFLTASSSEAASMIRSASAASARVFTAVMR